MLSEKQVNYRISMHLQNTGNVTAVATRFTIPNQRPVPLLSSTHIRYVRFTVFATMKFFALNLSFQKKSKQIPNFCMDV